MLLRLLNKVLALEYHSDLSMELTKKRTIEILSINIRDVVLMQKI